MSLRNIFLGSYLFQSLLVIIFTIAGLSCTNKYAVCSQKTTGILIGLASGILFGLVSCIFYTKYEINFNFKYKNIKFFGTQLFISLIFLILGILCVNNHCIVNSAMHTAFFGVFFGILFSMIFSFWLVLALNIFSQ